MEARGKLSIDPGRLDGGEPGKELELVVPFTGPETTAAALERAAQFARGLSARILLIAVHTLPYPQPFVCPSLIHAHLVDQLMELASQCPLPVEPQVLLTRDRMEGFRYALKPGSTVLVVTRRRAWRTQEEKLACALAHNGHKVALFEIT